MSGDLIVTMNAGSSSLRTAVFERRGSGLVPRLRLSLRGLPDALIWERRDMSTDEVHEERLRTLDNTQDAHQTALSEMLDRLLDDIDPERIVAFSHRVVHGGRSYPEPVKVTDDVLDDLASLSPLAPSHQPHNLAAIHRLAKQFPDVAQVACFDTSFHHSLDRNDRIFGLPKDLTERGILRYGFHGLSYDYIAGALEDVRPELAKARVIVAHLGHGASMCALKGGRSIATTMGLTALDGLPMGTRIGAIDPGIILHLIEELGYSPAEVGTLLYHRSGLLGISGISGEMQDLLSSDAPDARAAIDFFVYRCHREIGSLVAALGGVDALVLTGGISEHASQVRAQIVEGLGWLGIRLDANANTNGDLCISASDAAIPVLLIATDEETVLAREANACVAMS